MDELVRLADIAFDPKSSTSEQLFSYLAAPEQKVGDAVLVPLSKRQLVGFVVRVREVTLASLAYQPRSIISTIEGLQLPEKLIQLVQKVSRRYLCELPVAMVPATPPGVRERLVQGWVIQSKEFGELTAIEKEVLDWMSSNNNELEHNEKISPKQKKAIQNLTDRGILSPFARLKPIRNKKNAELMYRLHLDATVLEAFLKNEGRKKPAQAVTIIRLQESGGQQFSTNEIRAMAGVTEVTIKALISSKLLVEVTNSEDFEIVQPPEPNEFQKIAIEAITDQIESRRPKPFLLYGVTGSGKTEVFLRCAAQALQSGRKVLYLVPEIALASQVIAQLRSRFGNRVAILHSELSALERLQTWQKIRDGQVSVVLGPRSALFAPLEDIGLIILDEEHDGGYKQDQSPRYHARTVARDLSEIHNCPIVLGSATPSIETFSEAEDNEFLSDPGSLTLLSLPQRAAEAQLPKVHIHDLRTDYQDGVPAVFGQLLKEKINETLYAGNQVILFLNRRAYSPFLMCRDCGFRWECPHCAVTLSYHRSEARIRCHHCGYSQVGPDYCLKCESTKINPFGIGTEKVEELVTKEFPMAKVARLDRDVAQKKGATEEVIARFRAGDANVLIGTQMVAKGLDFPNVTLVGVIAADLSMNIPDFRAGERTFQLLTQVAGRAGRSVKRGEVVIQTFNPDLPAITCTQIHDYLMFYQVCLHERKLVNFPPNCHLVNIVVTSENRKAVYEVTEAIANEARMVDEWTTLGPAECPIGRIQSRWRRHLMIKTHAPDSFSILTDILRGKKTKEVQITVDVDPYSLM